MSCIPVRRRVVKGKRGRRLSLDCSLVHRTRKGAQVAPADAMSEVLDKCEENDRFVLVIEPAYYLYTSEGTIEESVMHIIFGVCAFRFVKFSRSIRLSSFLVIFTVFCGAPMFVCILCGALRASASPIMLVAATAPLYGILRSQSRLLVSIAKQYSCALPLLSAGAVAIFLSFIFSFDQRSCLCVYFFLTTAYQLLADAGAHHNSVHNVQSLDSENKSTLVYKLDVFGSVASFTTNAILLVGVLMNVFPNMKRVVLMESETAIFTAGSLMAGSLVIIQIAIFKRIWCSAFQKGCALYSTVPLVRSTKRLGDLDLSRRGRLPEDEQYIPGRIYFNTNETHLSCIPSSK